MLFASALTMGAESSNDYLDQLQQKSKPNNEKKSSENENSKSSIPVEIKGDVSTSVIMTSGKQNAEILSTASNTLFSTMMSDSEFLTTAKLFALAHITKKIDAKVGMKGDFRSSINKKSTNDKVENDEYIDDSSKNEMFASLSYDFIPNGSVTVGSINLHPAHLLGHNVFNDDMLQSVNFMSNFYGTNLLYTSNIGKSDWSFSVEPYYGFSPMQTFTLAYDSPNNSSQFAGKGSMQGREIWGGLAEFGMKRFKLLYGYQNFYLNDTREVLGTNIDDLSSSHSLNLYAMDLFPLSKLELLPFYAQAKNNSQYLSSTDRYGGMVKYIINDYLSSFVWYDKDKVKDDTPTVISAVDGDSLGVGVQYMVNQYITTLVNFTNAKQNVILQNETQNTTINQVLARISINF